jgi:LmbE family N-acetylglucosaminyl deacetylase
MVTLSLKLWARRLLWERLNPSLKECDLHNFQKSAIVFAPHEDDETLGCGGTIVKKKQAGADVKIVFMTDGSGSHSQLISPNELKSMRKSEGIAAAGILGVRSQDVDFLEFVDGNLAGSQTKAIALVKSILERDRPEEIFIPYYRDVISDHVATNQIVLSALKDTNLSATIYEYPIWFWNHWPWITFAYSPYKIVGFYRNLKNAPKSWLRLFKDFNCVVDLKGVTEIKRQALEQHKTQVSRIQNNPNWQTLADISNGEFVERFSQEQEIFRCYEQKNNE